MQDIIIETPKGYTGKYNWDQEIGYFRLKKVLPKGMVFPFDFGFIPQTKGEDGDPLDAIIISEIKTFPGCMIECRLIGAVLAEQSGKSGLIRNDRFFFIPALSRQYDNISHLDDLSLLEKDEIEDFFIQYNKAEGVEMRIIKSVDPKKAWDLIRESRKEIEDEAIL